nr:sugar isomerase domain-containing protein [uncultured Acetatifactor sp.]
MNGYIERAKQRLDEIEHTQRANIEKAGRLLASAIEQDRLIYVFGAGGHTSLVAGEMFFRIGGLANIYPIVEYGLTALSQARKFIQLERCLGLGSSLVAASGIGRGDVLLLFHTIGVNASCIQAAGEAKRLGATVIGIASDRWQDETPADAPIRSPGKENLRDLADIYVNDCNTVDDAVVGLEGMEAKAGPLSGIGTFAIAHMLELAAMEECLKRGVCPPVWENANTPEGERRNGALMDRYSGRVPML